MRMTKRTVHPCLYRINNTVTGDFYVGSAWRPMERRGYHWNRLKKNTHPNTLLQRAANKYGWWNFEFLIIRSWDAEDLDRNTLYRLEQQYLNSLNPKYNIARIVGRPHITEEAKEKYRKLYSKEWIITDPKGKELTITNLKKFCRENGLAQSHMWYVAQGKMSHSKGWKCRYADGSTPEYINKNKKKKI